MLALFPHPVELSGKARLQKKDNWNGNKNIDKNKEKLKKKIKKS